MRARRSSSVAILAQAYAAQAHAAWYDRRWAVPAFTALGWLEMAREGTACDRPPRRSGAQRRAAARVAAGAADAAVHRLKEQLAALQTRHQALLSALAVPEVAERLAEAAPALAALVAGGTPSPHDVLHRNVGLHAERLPAAEAPDRVWRQAQRGPRLEHRVTATSIGLRGGRKHGQQREEEIDLRAITHAAGSHE